jgi:hypothetical protein
MSDEKMVESVAKALYMHSLLEAKKAIDAHGFDASDLVEISKKISNESMTAKVIVFGSYIEEKTIDLMKLHLERFNSKEEEDCIFGFNGPLGSFSSRINMAYYLGWLSEKERKNLHSFRKIRNAFAHEAYKISPSDPKIASKISNISIDIYKEIEAINEGIYPNKLDCNLSFDQEFLFKMIYVAGNAFTDFLVGPASRSFRVDNRSFFITYDGMPETIKNIKINMATALLHIVPLHR